MSLGKQVKPLLLLLAVPLPPQSLEAIGPLIEERMVDTEYGPVGPLAWRGQPLGPSVWIQPYYGLPSRTDPRATLHAAQALNVSQIVAWDSAVAVNPMLGPGYPMLITDYIDFTRHQPQTFLEDEGMGGLSQTPAVCPRLTGMLSRVLPMAPGGVYLGVDGPRRETAAEARMYRIWGPTSSARTWCRRSRSPESWASASPAWSPSMKSAPNARRRRPGARTIEGWKRWCRRCPLSCSPGMKTCPVTALGAKLLGRPADEDYPAI